MRKATFTRTALMGAAIALGLGVSAPAMADSHSNGASHCAPGQKCQPQQRSDSHRKDQKAPQHAQSRDSHKTQQHADNHRASAPRVGQHAHGERISWSKKYHHLPKPRAHTHYERVDGRVVLVNDNTLAVVSVVGLAAVLLANN
ncbi:RcnB family protein [Acidimangrovimonas sediminis]|uniref:RcnB family protein n=1 Tax=Acidimangrovimonas sediminis TaxID=2056283 RepID=UPI000C803C9A|nr:RcnB family protein [Acidimangrovimonas sediminis]